MSERVVGSTNLAWSARGRKNARPEKDNSTALAPRNASTAQAREAERVRRRTPENSSALEQDCSSRVQETRSLPRIQGNSDRGRVRNCGSVLGSFRSMGVVQKADRR